MYTSGLHLESPMDHLCSINSIITTCIVLYEALTYIKVAANKCHNYFSLELQEGFCIDTRMRELQERQA
jgi:hypothetical protein